MESLDLSALGIGPLTGMAAALAAVTCYIISQIKRFFYKVPWKWTCKIPEGTWIVLSIAFPVAVCVLLNLDWFESLTGGALPEQFRGFSAAVTGGLVGIGAQKTYKASEMGKSYLSTKGIAVPQTYKPSESACPPPADPQPAPALPAQEAYVPKHLASEDALPIVKARLLTDWTAENPPTALLLTKDGERQVFSLDWSGS